ncbi:hypothetical protein [Pantoea rodasii]|uniref:hypothetical protein n=1 Tax=Pantoea rodasii TaxID=1076549 RepID=UPI0013901290|nr:hypothetical protein [Pantoea rodasii]
MTLEQPEVVNTPQTSRPVSGKLFIIFISSSLQPSRLAGVCLLLQQSSVAMSCDAGEEFLSVCYFVKIAAKNTYCP